MREGMLLFFFICNFLILAWIILRIFVFDKRIEKRMNYYFDIDKRSKKPKTKGERLKLYNSSLKKMNEAIRGKLSNINQDKIDQMLKASGVIMNPEEYIMLKWFLAAIVGGIFYFLTGKILLLVPGGIIGYVIPKLWISRKIRIRIQKFNEGLPDMITTVVGSLRSGYSFAQALKTVVEECESPIREEVALMLKEMNYGITMEEALNNFNQRMPSTDLELMIQTILIQRQVGGNLAGVLEIIVRTIRDRTKIQRQVHTLTSQGRLSGRVIGALPIGLGFMIYLVNPGYMEVLFSNAIGIFLIIAAVISGGIGFFLIHKLTKIEV